MILRGWVAFLVAVTLCSGAAAADTRHLTADERANFEPVLCEHPTTQAKDLICGAMRGYPGNPRGATLSLYAIAYGSFSKAGADEAYLSYGSSAEPHATNFGGGVLLARAGGVWRLVRWYPGGQMDNCLALPGAGKSRMLCLTGYTGQGEEDSSIWVKETPFGHDVAILKAQDTRGAGDGEGHGIAPPACGGGAPVLLSIDSLKQSPDPAAFAVASITYATAKDARDACKRGDFGHARVSKGEVKIVVDGARVKAVTPLRFAPTDY